MLTNTATIRCTAMGFLFTAALIAAGCGDSSMKRHAITGNVSYDGKPVEDGRIQFRSNEGRAFSAIIKGGKYEMESEVGNMKVEITGQKPIPGKFILGEGDDKTQASEQYIPAKYNTATTLTTEVKSGSNDIPFELAK